MELAAGTATDTDRKIAYRIGSSKVDDNEASTFYAKDYHEASYREVDGIEGLLAVLEGEVAQGWSLDPDYEWVSVPVDEIVDITNGVVYSLRDGSHGRLF